MKVSGWFELLFVNSMGMSFNTGLYVYIILLIAALVWGLWKTHKTAIDVQAKVAFLVCTALLGIPFYGHGTTSVIIGLIVPGLHARCQHHRVRGQHRCLCRRRRRTV